MMVNTLLPLTAQQQHILLIWFSLVLIPVALGYQPQKLLSPRRTFLVTTCCSSLLVPATTANANVIRANECIQGQGDGCSEFASENEFIRSLQEKSASNRERNEKEARDAFYLKNYPDFFATVGKTMVKKPDGSFMIVDAAEVKKLQDDGRLYYETPMSKGGKLVDYTQKPVLVLKD